MKIRTEFFSFRNRVVVIVVGVTLGALSLLYTNDMARRLKEKEQHDVALWAHAMERVTRDVLGGSIQDPFVADIMSNGNNIPFIITNENLEVINSLLILPPLAHHGLGRHLRMERQSPRPRCLEQKKHRGTPVCR